MPRQDWPPYRTVRSLLLAHVGRTAVVMGGGPTLAKHIEECPSDALYIAVNDHGLRLLKDRAAKLQPRAASYVVACDKIEERARADIGPKDLPPPKRDGQPWGLPVISRHVWADYRLTFMPAANSGMAAAWLARFMGCAPIILTGMDLWSGKTYHDAPNARSSGHTITDAQHFRRWCTLLARYPGQYRTLGCSPLLQAKCAHYDPSEPADTPPDAQKLLQELQSTWVRLTRDTRISQRSFPAGAVLELNAAEADKLIRTKKAVRAKPGEVANETAIRG